MLRNSKILGVNITNEREEYILEYVVKSLLEKREKYFIVTPNPEIIVYATKHKNFLNLLNHARISLCDGVGVALAGRILGVNVGSRITGADFVEKLCGRIAEKPITVGFLGGRDGVAQKTSECLKKVYPGLKIVFVSEADPDERIVSLMKEKSRENIDLLFVAYGFPKQEEFLAAYLDRLPVTIVMAVGGTFDYLSGKVKRAPLVMRRLGLEWLYRLIQEPWRWRRQLSLISFAEMLAKQRLALWLG